MIDIDGAVRILQASGHMASAQRIMALYNDIERQSELIAALRNEIARKDKRIKELEGRNKQQEISILSLAKSYKERNEALKAAQQCIADFLDVYGRGCSKIVLDEAAKSLKHDALRLVNRCLAKPELEAAQSDGRTYAEGCAP